MKLKTTLRRWLWKLWRPSNEAIFTKFYVNNVWEDAHSLSGPGSNLAQTAAVRAAVPDLLAELGVRRLLDIPCGDFHWMSNVPLAIDEYIGADVVEPLIRTNNEKYARPQGPKISFRKLDVTIDALPRVDLVFCRDCLVHLCNRDVFRALDRVRRSGATYLLTTTFPARTSQWDIGNGDWRPLNLEAPPFSLPTPLVLIDEKCPQAGGEFADKSLGLWRIADFPADVG